MSEMSNGERDEALPEPVHTSPAAATPKRRRNTVSAAPPQNRQVARDAPVGTTPSDSSTTITVNETTTDQTAEIPIGSAEASSAYRNGRAAASAETLYEVEVAIREQADAVGTASHDLASTAAGLLRLIADNAQRMSQEQVARVNELLAQVSVRDYLDPDFWQGIGMVVRYQIDEQVAFVQRRLSGQYSIDPYGMDRELIEVVRPFFTFLLNTWWRTSVEGLAQVPTESRAMLVANHSGVLPWDGAMVATAMADGRPEDERIVRCLYLNWFSTLPLIAPLLTAMGQVPGLPENAVRLLNEDQLVCVFPEGLKGVGKLYKDRYQLARFGRGGFVQAALRTGAPLVPVAVVGAEEIYPMLANFEPLAKLLGFPYFPITPFFPWLGPLGVIPLPTRWSIQFGAPLSTVEYGPDAADDPLTVFMLSELVRTSIQDMINARLAVRTSVF